MLFLQVIVHTNFTFVTNQTRYFLSFLESYNCETKEAKTIITSLLSYLRERKAYSIDQRLLFLKQLQLILASGISIMKGVSLLEKKVNGTIAVICRQLLRELQNGRTLSQAMERNKLFFLPLMRSVIGAGEQSGELQQSFITLIDYYTHQKEFKKQLGKAFIYPCILLTAALGVLLFFLLYVLPELSAAYSSLQAQQSSFLQLALQVNGFIRKHITAILITLPFLLVILYRLLPVLGQQLLKISYIRKIYYLSLEARFCRVLSLLLNSGTNITDAVAIASGTVKDLLLVTEMYTFRDNIERGMDIPTAAQRSFYHFTPLTKEFIVVGAYSGYLPDMLTEAAQVAETDYKEYLVRVQELITPMLLLLAAALTAGIVCAVLGPMFDLFSAIPG